MNEFSPMDELKMQAAKAKLWRRLEARLPERGVGVYQHELRRLRASAETVEMSRLQAVQRKEHLLDALPDRPVFHLLPSLKRGLAASVLSLMAVTFILPTLEARPVLAAHFNFIDPVSGSITLNGVPVTERTTVRSGDRVALGDSSIAHLLFSDGSRVTLGEDSMLTIRELRTHTRLTLNEGLLWAQTLDAKTSDPKLFLETRDGTVGVYPHSSLDMDTDSVGTSVRVAENLARVDLPHSRRLTLGPGAELDLNSLGSFHVSMSSESSNPWWDFNLKEGEAHQAEMLAARDEEQPLQARVLPGDLLYPFKTLSEGIQIHLSFSSEGRRQALAESADHRLLEAQTLIEQGRSDDAQIALDRYEAIAREVDPSESQNLMLARYTDASLLLATDAERPHLRLQQASQKITELPQLLSDGDAQGARDTLAAYQEASEAAFKDIDAVPLEDRKDVVLSLLEQRVQDWEILKLAEALPQGGDLVDVQAQILSDLSYMTLSLQTESVDAMSGLISSGSEDVQSQELLLEQLQSNESMPQDVVKTMDTARNEITDQTVQADAPVVTVDLEALPHADQAEQDSEGSH